MIKRIFLLLMILCFATGIAQAMTFHPSENDLNFNRNLVLKMTDIPIRIKKNYHLFKVAVSLDNRLTASTDTYRSYAAVMFSHDQLRSVYPLGLKQLRNVRMTCYYRNASGRTILSEAYPYASKQRRHLDAVDSTNLVLGHVGLTPKSMVFRVEDNHAVQSTALLENHRRLID